LALAVGGLRTCPFEPCVPANPLHLGMMVGIIFHEGTSSELHTESGKVAIFQEKDTFIT